ncbi:MAG: family 20 glycosylhydrolase [Marinifilaceae bacterium]
MRFYLILLSFVYMQIGLANNTKTKDRVAACLLPAVQELTVHKGIFSAKEISATVAPDFDLDVMRWLQKQNVRVNPKASKQFIVKKVSTLAGVTNNPNEAYALNITPAAVVIEAITSTGAYYALQTLSQLNEGKHLRFPACSITDWPEFRIRGLMQDVGRSYISMQELKREIDVMSRYKINVFHWHLTENQAWRLESKRFPELVAAENMTRMPGKFYTIEEAKELVEYCKERHITLIPEIDMPGHSAAFVRALKHDMQSPEGMLLLKELMDEVCAIFDVPYIHIGTDEVQFTNRTFVPEMVSYIRAKGKKVISWNPGWHYKPGEIDMTQLWSYRGKAQPGIPAIDCRFHYLNHFDAFADLVGLYTSKIYNVSKGSDDIAGVILAIWHDRYVEPETQVIAQNNLYPSLLAMAERAWLGGGTQYFDKSGTMLWNEQCEEYKMFANFEQRMLRQKELLQDSIPFHYAKQTDIKWRITDAFPNNGDLTASFAPEKQQDTAFVYNGNTYNTKTAIGAGIYLRHVWGTLIPGFYKEPKENHTAYAWTWVYSPQKQDVAAWIEFQNYGRSEMDLAPKQGKWDYRGSRIWLNDEEILPPVWTATHTVKSNETPLGNENFMARQATPITLNKGWNKVLLKLPVGKFSTPEVRLQKWMFTFVVVNPNGKGTPEGLIYSADKP